MTECYLYERERVDSLWRVARNAKWRFYDAWDEVEDLEQQNAAELLRKEWQRLSAEAKAAEDAMGRFD